MVLAKTALGQATQCQDRTLAQLQTAYFARKLWTHHFMLLHLVPCSQNGVTLPNFQSFSEFQMRWVFIRVFTTRRSPCGLFLHVHTFYSVHSNGMGEEFCPFNRQQGLKQWAYLHLEQVERIGARFHQLPASAPGPDTSSLCASALSLGKWRHGGGTIA